MSDPASSISKAFQTFMSEAPQHAQAWGGMIQGMASASALDEKTASLAYLAVLAALRLESGIPFPRSSRQTGRRLPPGGHQRHPDRPARRRQRGNPGVAHRPGHLRRRLISDGPAKPGVLAPGSAHPKRMVFSPFPDGKGTWKGWTDGTIRRLFAGD